jgi:hypothetical protein
MDDLTKTTARIAHANAIIVAAEALERLAQIFVRITNAMPYGPAGDAAFEEFCALADKAAAQSLALAESAGCVVIAGSGRIAAA